LPRTLADLSSRWKTSCLSVFSLLSEPRVESDLAHVSGGVPADAVERRGTDPQDRPASMVRVPIELGVEEVDGGVLRPQQLLGVVEVLPGLRDRPLGVVVEPAVLVAGDDVPGLSASTLSIASRHESSHSVAPPHMSVQGALAKAHS
jgi:hypothetical protein